MKISIPPNQIVRAAAGTIFLVLLGATTWRILFGEWSAAGWATGAFGALVAIVKAIKVIPDDEQSEKSE